MIENISQFLSGTVIPLNTVTVAVPATPYPHGGVLKITYAAATGSVQKSESGTLETWGKLPDEFHPIAPRPKEQLEAELSAIAWELGAGYLYRWYERCGDYGHLFRNMYSFADGEPFADDSAVNAADYLPDAETYGVWIWEFNVAWKRGVAIPWQFESWRQHDPSLEDDGRRSIPFPGWDDSHPGLTTDEPCAGFESHYYFAVPKKYNKNTDVLAKGLK